MRVRLDQVREHPVTLREEVAFDVSDMGDLDGEGFLSLGPVQMRADLRRAEGLTSEGGFLLRGHLEYPQSLSCYRCLEPTHEEKDYDFELLIQDDAAAQLESSTAAESDLELEESDLDILHVAEEVDLAVILDEQLRLNLPMKPLCSDQCRGLCPTCGANLNTEPCDCSQTPADTRWAGLAALRDRFPDSK